MSDCLTINLENCYGIKSLNQTFDFKTGRQWLIYAPNGVMKTSFAKTFQDMANGKQPVDRVYPDRISKATATDENAVELDPARIFVIEPYNQSYRSGRISTLAVNSVLKAQYDQIYNEIADKRAALVKLLAGSSGMKKDIEASFCADFNLPLKQFFTATGRVEREVNQETNPDFRNVKYNQIFNDKVVAFAKDPALLKIVSDYTAIYDRLLEKSTYFKKGIFNHNNASTVAKNLKANGWFDSGHTVRLNSSTDAKSVEILTEKELENIIQAEKDEIIADKALNEQFEKLDKELRGNAELREFREFLLDHKNLIPEFQDLSAFKQKLWIAYIADNLSAYSDMMKAYDEGEAVIKTIVDTAKAEATKWLRVIDIFNERFSVPFVVRMDNQDDVILKSEAPIIKFDFKDPYTGAAIPLEESKLYEILSNGEKRALYILNIIFEVEARREMGQKTLFVVDDIADSFDYKNKYAIIEYLKDITGYDVFDQIILTHNFDFFRTVGGRLHIPRNHRLHSVKTADGIILVEEKYQKNPFLHWRKHLDNPEMLIASIPFVRNLAEYCGYEDQEENLTSLLHIKPNTKATTIGDLQGYFNAVLSMDNQADLSPLGNERLVFDLIGELCQVICNEVAEVVELEKKIVLAIGIRLKAEEYMIKEIADDNFVLAINSAQTYKLSEKFKFMFPDRVEKVDILERVNIMTPENIHLNSFMYEPILDMSNEYLKKLCVDVGSL